jgi:L,D-transpeptidase catalytic domain
VTTMSTHTIGLLLAILGGFVPIVLTVLPSQTFASTLLGQNLLAQTPAPSSLPEDRFSTGEAAPTTPELMPSVKKSRVTQGSQWGLCRRKQNTSQRSSGFTGDTTGTYISNIQVNLYSNTYSTVTLNWANENLSIETLPMQFNASPGAGNCNLDCRSTAQSQKRGSHCTPLSPPTYLVQGYDCVLPKYSEAKFVTWFNGEREIAFHAYTVPSYPASHGCMRLLTKDRGAEWIYDNTLAGITQVKIDWNPLAESLSPKCWSGDRLIPRPTKKRFSKGEATPTRSSS